MTVSGIGQVIYLRDKNWWESTPPKLHTQRVWEEKKELYQKKWGDLRLAKIAESHIGTVLSAAKRGSVNNIWF